jgi:hypothetical protein
VFVQTLQPICVLALLGAGALAYLVPGGTAAFAKVDRLAAQRQVHLDDYALVEEDLAKLRRNQTPAHQAEHENPGMVAMR